MNQNSKVIPDPEDYEEPWEVKYPELEQMVSIKDLINHIGVTGGGFLNEGNWQGKLDAILNRAQQIVTTTKYETVNEIDNEINTLENLRKAINSVLQSVKMENYISIQAKVITEILATKKRLMERLGKDLAILSKKTPSRAA